MTNQFDNLTATEIAETIYWDVEGTNVPAALKAVDALDAGKRTDVVNNLEKLLVEELRLTSGDFKMFGPLLDGLDSLTSIFGDALSKEEKEEMAKEDAADLDSMHGACKIVGYVAEVKGDTAHPVIKEVVKTLATLPDADYNSLMKLTKAVVKAYDTAVAAPQAKETPKAPNPFKKPKKGGYKI